MKTVVSQRQLLQVLEASTISIMRRAHIAAMQQDNFINVVWASERPSHITSLPVRENDSKWLCDKTTVSSIGFFFGVNPSKIAISFRATIKAFKLGRP